MKSTELHWDAERERESNYKLESQLKCEIEVSRQLSAIKLLLKVDNHKIYY